MAARVLLAAYDAWAAAVDAPAARGAVLACLVRALAETSQGGREPLEAVSSLLARRARQRDAAALRLCELPPP